MCLQLSTGAILDREAELCRRLRAMPSFPSQRHWSTSPLLNGPDINFLSYHSDYYGTISSVNNARSGEVLQDNGIRFKLAATLLCCENTSVILVPRTPLTFMVVGAILA